MTNLSPSGYSAVEERKLQIGRQLEHLHRRLVKKTRRHYDSDQMYERERRRAHTLIKELESELSALNFPEEYEELPAAVVAEELGLTNKRIRQLIELGEIESSGHTAHARVSRSELGRLAELGTSKLLRLAREEAEEIFENCAGHLRSEELTPAEIAHRRLEARESWHGPHAPAYLVALELSRGEYQNALASLKYILAFTDQGLRSATLSNLERLLRNTTFKSDRARAAASEILRTVGSYPTDPAPDENPPVISVDEAELSQRASVLAYAVHREIGGAFNIRGEWRLDKDERHEEPAHYLLVRDVIYTLLYAEATCDCFESSRRYLNTLTEAAPARVRAPKLLADLRRDVTSDPNQQ